MSVSCEGDKCSLVETKKSGFRSWFFVPLFIISTAVIAQFFLSEQKIVWIIPYALLLTPFRSLNLEAWKYFAPVDTSVLPSPIAVPEILAKDYTYDLLRELSHNFRYPVVVKGLFNGTTGVTKWATEDYLPTVLGNFTIPIVRNAVVGTLQDDRVVSRYTFNGSEAGSAEALHEACNVIAEKDLDLSRIWKGFGTKAHKTLVGSQFVIGKSVAPPSKDSTGSDWHCAIGNNWFVQVAGKKSWQFIEPKYSPYLAPLKGGVFNMWTGNSEMGDLEKHIPRKFTTLEPGDLLYNPDWTWHKVVNFEGFSIGIPIRERNISLSIQNNKYFSSIVLLTKLLQPVGLSLGGFPPPSKATEHDN